MQNGHYTYCVRVNRETARAFRILAAQRALTAGALFRSLVADEVARSQHIGDDLAEKSDSPN